MARSLPPKGRITLPGRRLSRRKTKEVLRLRFEVGLGLRQIARSCSIGLGTVHDYLQRAEAAGVTWPLGDDWGEDRLEAALFGGPPQAFTGSCREVYIRGTPTLAKKVSER